MIRSFTRWAALAATAALALMSAGAFAQATITLSDTNCSDFQLTGTPGNRTLTCIVSSAPVCTVTGPSTGTNGTPITLSASCSPAATSWTWTGGNCAGVTTSSCSAVEPNSITRQYTVAGTNGSFVGSASPPKSVVWSLTPPAAPSNCSISGAPGGTQAAGVLVNLTMNCSGGGAATSWAWTGGGANGQTTQAVGPITVNTTTTFTATASNTGGPSTPASATVTIGGGGGGGGPISCAGFATTHVLDMNWTPKPQLGYTINVGGFGPSDAIVVRFTTSASTTSTAMGYIQAAEFSDSPSGRTAALSATPCDFVGLPKVGGGTSAFGPNDNAPKAYFTLFNANTGLPTLLPSTTYYFNISNSTPSTCQSSGSCNMIITLSKPSGS